MYDIHYSLMMKHSQVFIKCKDCYWTLLRRACIFLYSNLCICIFHCWYISFSLLNHSIVQIFWDQVQETQVFELLKFLISLKAYLNGSNIVISLIGLKICWHWIPKFWCIYFFYNLLLIQLWIKIPSCINFGQQLYFKQ